MEMILGIFAKLGVDYTIAIQFAIVTLLFVILKMLFLNKLKEVLSTREEKTTKLETEANKKMNQALEASALYKNKMDKCYSDAQEYFVSKKNEINTREKEKLDSYEYHVSTEFEKKKVEYVKNVHEKKEVLMARSGELANNLVDKMIH